MKIKPFFEGENISSGRNSSLDWIEQSAPGALNISGREFLGLSLPKRKIKIFLFLALAGLFLLGAKSFYLQIIQGDHYFALAEENRLKTQRHQAQRGVIYDRNNRLLVENVSGFSLRIIPADLPVNQEERQKIFQWTAEIAEIPLEEIRKKVEENKYYFQPITIKTGISYQQAIALKIASADLPGAVLAVDSWRNYIGGSAFSPILGYVGKISAEEFQRKKGDYLLTDNFGKTGLEKHYQEILRGEPGWKKIEVDSLGRERKIISEKVPVSGSDLVLTVDFGLQKEVYRILEERLGREKAGAVVIVNPENGEVLALVDYPSYDNNLFGLGISQEDYYQLISDSRNPLFRRAVSGEYPSGSIIKPAIAAAGLEEGIISRWTTIVSRGGLWVADRWFFPDWKAGGHGRTDLIKALAESVNTYFYCLGGGCRDFSGLGVVKIASYFKEFGLGEKTGIDLPGEHSGLVPNPDWKEQIKGEEWYIGDTYHLAIGQGDLLVTPIQAVNFTAAIANGGILYRPRLVKEIIHPEDRRELLVPSKLNYNFISPENFELVRQGMRQAVISGSAVSLAGLPVEAAAKTGTAQWHSEKENHAWLAAFAPYRQPEFCLVVLVEQGGEGSTGAAPIARDILDYWFSRSERN